MKECRRLQAEKEQVEAHMTRLNQRSENARILLNMAAARDLCWLNMVRTTLMPRQASRDPNAAWQKLATLETAEGGPKGAERALGHGGVALLGELRGKSGWLASAALKTEREVAERSAQAIPVGLVRLREAETRAGQGYVAAVDAQRARDAVEVPGLSPAAWTAVQRVEKAIEHAEGGHKDANAWQRLIARQDGEVGEAWAREVLARPEVMAESRVFQEAATRRLGEEWGARDRAHC